MKLVVVLGHKLNDDGTMDNELYQRLELGLRTFNEVKPDYLCVCGGCPNKKAGVTEASLMFEYLINHNVPEEQIISEDKSLTTLGNAFNLKRILKGEVVSEIYLVSSEYHFTRTNYPKCHKLFEKAFRKTKIIKVFK